MRIWGSIGVKASFGIKVRKETENENEAVVKLEL